MPASNRKEIEGRAEQSEAMIGKESEEKQKSERKQERTAKRSNTRRNRARAELSSNDEKLASHAPVDAIVRRRF